MKQLNTYLEGLLSNSNKTLTTTAIAIGEYIEKEIIPKNSKSINLTYSFSNKTLTLTNNSKYSYALIYDYNVGAFIDEYNVEKLILNGSWEVKLISYQEWKYSIKIESDRIVRFIGGSSSGGSRDYIKNLNIKSNIVDLNVNLGLYKPNIKTQVLIMKNLLRPLLKDLNTNTLIYRGLADVALSRIVNNIQIPIKYTSGSIQRAITKSRTRIEKIKDTDPEEVFWIREYHVKNIIVQNEPGSGKKYILLFTKTPKSYKSKYPEVYEMKNGWYAMWLEDLEQFGL